MNKNKVLATLLGSVTVAGLATPASAQMFGTGGETFTGPRVEAIVGYDINKAGSDIDDDGNEDNDESFEGIVYGGALGYDFDFNGFVLGAEAELTGSTADVDVNEGDVEDAGFGNVDSGRDFYAGVRAGARVGEQGLAYVKGGYTNARYDVRVNDGTSELSTDLDADGYRLGAGFEYATTERSFAKIEYRYSNYSEAELDFGDGVESDRFDVDLDRHQIVVGYGLRF